MTDAEPTPAERIIWAEAILELAGWEADMTLIFVYNESRDPAAEKWMKKPDVDEAQKQAKEEFHE